MSLLTDFTQGHNYKIFKPHTGYIFLAIVSSMAGKIYPALLIVIAPTINSFKSL